MSMLLTFPTDRQLNGKNLDTWATQMEVALELYNLLVMLTQQMDYPTVLAKAVGAKRPRQIRRAVIGIGSMQRFDLPSCSISHQLFWLMSVT